MAQGYGKRETSRVPYDDYGLITIAPITGSGVAQAVATFPTTLPLAGWCLAISCSWSLGANEEHVKVISVDTVNQTFTAIVKQPRIRCLVTLANSRWRTPAVELPLASWCRWGYAIWTGTTEAIRK